MAKKVDIDEKIAQLNALKEVIESTESLMDNAQYTADSFRKHTDVCDTSSWQYKTYQEYKRQVEAYKAIIEALYDMV